MPHAGGLPELLTAADAGEVDAVIVESIDRLSRMTADGTQIERRLEERNVALFDVRISYDKPAHILDLSVLLTSDFPNPPEAATTNDCHRVLT